MTLLKFFGQWILQTSDTICCAQKIYKIRQNKLSQFIYFSLVLREQKETKPNILHLGPIWYRLEPSIGLFCKHDSEAGLKRQFEIPQPRNTLQSSATLGEKEQKKVDATKDNFLNYFFLLVFFGITKNPYSTSFIFQAISMAVQ